MGGNNNNDYQGKGKGKAPVKRSLSSPLDSPESSPEAKRRKVSSDDAFEADTEKAVRDSLKDAANAAAASSSGAPGSSNNPYPYYRKVYASLSTPEQDEHWEDGFTPYQVNYDSALALTLLDKNTKQDKEVKNIISECDEKIEETSREYIKWNETKADDWKNMFKDRAKEIKVEKRYWHRKETLLAIHRWEINDLLNQRKSSPNYDEKTTQRIKAEEENRAFKDKEWRPEDRVETEFYIPENRFHSPRSSWLGSSPREESEGAFTRDDYQGSTPSPNSPPNHNNRPTSPNENNKPTSPPNKDNKPSS